jgi:hypothetical protein
MLIRGLSLLVYVLVTQSLFGQVEPDLGSALPPTAPTDRNSPPDIDGLKKLQGAMESTARSFREASSSLTGTEAAPASSDLRECAIALETEAGAIKKSGASYPMERLKVPGQFCEPGIKSLRDAGKAAEASRMEAIVRGLQTNPPNLTLATSALIGAGPSFDRLAEDVPQCCGRDIRTIVGFEQAGAANSKSKQTIFLNFFFSAPVPWSANRQAWREKDGMGPRLRWFSEFRLTSAPRQIDSSLVDFPSGFSTLFAGVKANELAQAAEFLTGIGWRFFSFRRPFADSDGANHRVAIYPLVVAGASGVLGDPPNPQPYVVPELTDSQWPLFNALFNGDRSCSSPTSGTDFAPGCVPPSRQPPADPSATPPIPTQPERYIGFVEKDSSKFAVQYFAGFRFLDQYIGRFSSRGAARLDLLIGQNKAVTGGKRHGLVARIDAFLPLHLGGENNLSDVIYIYASGQFAFAPDPDSLQLDQVRAKFGADRVFLKPVADIAPTNPNLYIRNTNPLHRDFYRIGVGLDFLRLVQNYRETRGKVVEKVDAASGTGQKGIVGHQFDKSLVARTADARGYPVPEVKAEWTAPDTGASCIFPNGTSTFSNTTDSVGRAEAVCRPNNTKGKYSVRVESNGKDSVFNLENVELETLTIKLDKPEVEPGRKVADLSAAAQQGTKKIAGITVTFTLPAIKDNEAGGRFPEAKNEAKVTTDNNGVAKAPEITTTNTTGEFELTAEAGGKTSKAKIVVKAKQ